MGKNFKYQNNIMDPQPVVISPVGRGKSGFKRSNAPGENNPSDAAVNATQPKKSVNYSVDKNVSSDESSMISDSSVEKPSDSLEDNGEKGISNKSKRIRKEHKITKNISMNYPKKFMRNGKAQYVVEFAFIDENGDERKGRTFFGEHQNSNISKNQIQNEPSFIRDQDVWRKYWLDSDDKVSAYSDLTKLLLSNQ